MIFEDNILFDSSRKLYYNTGILLELFLIFIILQKPLFMNKNLPHLHKQNSGKFIFKNKNKNFSAAANKVPEG
ncbi:MAG: hypothetical protein B1H08_06240 [Candidatus Omnitrophica bacterium 4484_171]|nr:MAG: hypothetical protein B1H08_06240 [Candidatus Omnitrophica bacterium 4484_171]